MKKIICAFCALIMLFCSVSVYAACTVTALMYHNVTSDESRYNDWCISEEQLENDINYFTQNGYIPITATELANEDMSNLDGRKILLMTFDDGYAEWYTKVFPILKRTNTKATMFVVGSYVNRYGYLSEAEIHEMANSGLIEIGNHTRYIHSMPLDTLKTLYNSDNIGDIVEDIKTNNEYLSQITSHPITSVAWPYGYYTDRLDKIVKGDLGCRISFSTTFGATYYNGDLSVVFNRINRDYDKSTEEIYELAENQRRIAGR